MDKALFNELLGEAIALTERPNVLDGAFDKQREFIEDPARLKALFCTRRAAKSYTSGLYLVKEALEHPKSNSLFMGLTRDSAKGIIWKDILKEIDQKYGLGISFNETALTATFPNGSVIWATGVDADSDEMRKLLGRKYRLAVLDEASMYSIDCRLLIYGILKPAVADSMGTICVLGTASNITSGLFYDITHGDEHGVKEAGWKVFEWSAHDNPHMGRQWQAELDEIERDRPLFKETSLFKQWYLNQWVVDEDAKVYKFGELRNSIRNLPVWSDRPHYVLGLDLAHSPDSTAFVVGCYHDTDPHLYFVESYKQTKMDITDVALKIKELDFRYRFDVKVVDGANKQAVAELNNRHAVNLVPADKREKVEFILLMNDDFVQGKIQLLPATRDLKAEYAKLVWLTDANGKVKEPKKENPIIHQDLCDAALYLWRYCYQYLFRAPKPLQNKNEQKVWESAHIEKLIAQVRQEQNPNELDLNWNEEWDSQDSEFM